MANPIALLVACGLLTGNEQMDYQMELQRCIDSKILKNLVDQRNGKPVKTLEQMTAECWKEFADNAKGKHHARQ
jgi:hypothetical protein